MLKQNRNTDYREDLGKYYAEKGNLRLKYTALASIGVSIILMLVMAFWHAQISASMMQLMRGCSGLFALVFVVLITILVYRVNVSYFNDRRSRK